MVSQQGLLLVTCLLLVLGPGETRARGLQMRAGRVLELEIGGERVVELDDTVRRAHGHAIAARADLAH